MRIEGLTDAEIASRPHRISGPVADSLLGRGAITRERALTYAPDSPQARRDLARLYESGIVRATADGRCWFDLRAYYVAQARRERTRAAIAVPVAIVCALVAVLFYRGGA